MIRQGKLLYKNGIPTSCKWTPIEELPHIQRRKWSDRLIYLTQLLDVSTVAVEGGNMTYHFTADSVEELVEVFAHYAHLWIKARD